MVRGRNALQQVIATRASPFSTNGKVSGVFRL
jgi:hypothetical protein